MLRQPRELPAAQAQGLQLLLAGMGWDGSMDRGAAEETKGRSIAPTRGGRGRRRNARGGGLLRVGTSNRPIPLGSNYLHISVLVLRAYALEKTPTRRGGDIGGSSPRARTHERPASVTLGTPQAVTGQVALEASHTALHLPIVSSYIHIHGSWDDRDNCGALQEEKQH